MTDNIIPMREPRAKRVRKALDAWHAATAQWIEETINLATELKAARDECGNNHRFSVWLAENNCDDLGKNARAAFIHIGEHIELARQVLHLTDRKSIELIWEREIKPIAERQASSERSEDGVERTMPAESQKTAPISQENSEPQFPPSDTGAENFHRGRQSALLGRNFGKEIAAIFLNKDARATLGKLNGPNWKLLLQAYHGGLLPSPTETTIKNPNMRLFFPYGSNRFLGRIDLTSKNDRATAVDLLAQMIAHKDELLAEPERVEAILADKERTRRAEQKAAAIQERAAKALAALPSNESEVIMFGKRMWPIIEGETIGSYDFRTLQVAVWKFTDLNRWMHRDSPGSRAINIRNSTKWDRHFIGELLKDSELRFKIDRIYQLVHAITRLMEENPEGECKEPLTPLVLG